MEGWPIGRTGPWTYGGYVVAVCAVLLATSSARAWIAHWAWMPIAVGVAMAHPMGRLGWPTDREYLERHSRHVTSYRGLPRLVECLGTKLHVYHSEIGVVGLAFLHGRVTDLGGLMSPRLALGQTSFDDLCLSDPPDAIFLPHRNYRSLNATIRDSDCLQQFERVVANSSSPLYVRRDLIDRFQCRAEPDGPT